MHVFFRLINFNSDAFRCLSRHLQEFLDSFSTGKNDTNTYWSQVIVFAQNSRYLVPDEAFTLVYIIMIKIIKYKYPLYLQIPSYALLKSGRMHVMTSKKVEFTN